MLLKNRPLALLPALAASVLALGGAWGSHAKASVDFAREVKPIFEKHCWSCHGPDKQKNGLRLDLRAHALKGGDDHGVPFKAGDSKSSVLIQFVSGEDPDNLMPPKDDRLSSAEIATLKAWIDEGALWPDDGSRIEDPRSHWSYRPIARPPLPNVADTAANISNPVDRFIVAKLSEKHLALSAQADRRTLLRRLHFVVTGLPPTLEEVQTFEKDPDPRAYEKKVAELLSSPHYGEKWARHWLDVVRFADSNGFETNHERPNAWRYRDYVIEAFNNDKPYDRFMFEQIAGDAVGEDVATGFIVAGPWDRVKGQDKNLQLMQRTDELSDMVNATGTTFLATTMVCAKCHNHKFDPVPQTDFYAMQSIFAGVQHGERPVRSSESEANRKKAEELEKQLGPINMKLASFQPKAAVARSFVIDDEPVRDAATDGPSVTELRKPKSAKPILYDAGTAKGQADDPGDAMHFPNFAASYRYFSEEPGTDCFAWEPKAAGRFRIWLSWGAWTTHAPDARYVLDLDGDLKTTNDQTEIARVNQRQFADGQPAVPNERRWSGFKQAGVHGLTLRSRIVLRAGDVRAPTVADMVLLEEIKDDSHPGPAPHLRPPVTHLANTEVFDPVQAKFVQFNITATQGSEPCIDELEIYSSGTGSRNVALARLGAKATSGGDYPNNEKHKLSHINDGLYGNSQSWIALQKGAGGWVQIELAQPREINRIVWSRDRGTEGRVYDDRLAIGYEIAVSMDGNAWQTVASSADRLDARFRKKVQSIPSVSNVPAAELAQVDALRKKQAQLAARIEALSVAPMAYAGKFDQPEPTHRLHRGDFLSPKEVVAPDGLSILRDVLGTFNLPPDAPEQQRRIAFAKWLTDKRNPLPARVMVNRLWHYIFGTGIVATPSDFGLMGFKPTHPELLDWLAAEFISSGWSVKHIQELILTSATFRQSSQPVPAAMQVDAGTTLLWRYPPHRLDAEIIRDSILSATGSLDLTMGGPGFLLFEPNANYSRNWVAKTHFEAPDYRRMIYTLKLRMEQDAIFSAFDIPDSGQVCPNRARSTTPLQALNLFNSGFLLEQAERLANRAIARASKNTDQQISAAFELAFARSPDATEKHGAKALVQTSGLPALCRALLNSNEFLFIE